MSPVVDPRADRRVRQYTALRFGMARREAGAVEEMDGLWWRITEVEVRLPNDDERRLWDNDVDYVEVATLEPMP